ncbi:MAG: helix-turn-helix domain-containing protein [Myxococcales bacterium]|nr:helix-turn-helix domain-containing protein [Myxococcales bacterium]
MSNVTETGLFSSAEELEQANREAGWNLEYHQLMPGPFFSGFACRAWADSLVMRESFVSSLEVRGEPPSDMTAIIIPGKPCARVTLNGAEVTEGRLFLVPPGAAIDAFVLGELEAYSIYLPESVFQEAARCVDPSWHDRRPSEALSLRAAPQRVDALRRELGMWLGGADSTDDLAHQVRASNFALKVAALTLENECDSEFEQAYRSVAHRKQLSLAREYMDVNFQHAVKMTHVCAYAGVGLRTLERVFQHELNLSPSRYLLARRLSTVRRVLVSSGPGRGVIKRIAIDHGFTHMGRFSVEYRRQFGETPSQTLNEVRLPIPVSVH